MSLHPTDNAGNNNVHNTNTSLSSNEVSYAPAGPGGTGGGTVGGTAVNLALRVDKSKALAGSGMAVPCGGEAGDGGYEGTGPIGAEGGTGGGGSTPGMPMAGVGLYAGGVVPGTPNGRKGVHKGFVALARQNEPVSVGRRTGRRGGVGKRKEGTRVLHVVLVVHQPWVLERTFGSGRDHDFHVL